MIFLLVAFLLVTLVHYIRVARHRGGATVARELALVILAGLVAGVFVALGARVGMRLIAMANDAVPRISLRGTSVVAVMYCGAGALCGLLYGGVFRRLLRGNGVAYGVLLTVATWYPLGHAGAQQLVEPPGLVALALWSGAIIALMWVPYAWVLEGLLSAWERRKSLTAHMERGTVPKL